MHHDGRQRVRQCICLTSLPLIPKGIRQVYQKDLGIIPLIVDETILFDV